MRDQQITLFNLDEMFDFVEAHATQEVFEKFLDLVKASAEKAPKVSNTIVTRFTNDPATRHGQMAEMSKLEGILHFPLPNGVYFYNVLEVEDNPAGTLLEAGKTYKTKALIFIVLDLEKMVVEDQTHNLIG